MYNVGYNVLYDMIVPMYLMSGLCGAHHTVHGTPSINVHAVFFWQFLQ